MVSIPGYEDKYKIDEQGNVYSYKRGKPKKLKPDTSGDGYARFTLCKDGKTKKYFGHRLMMLAYGVEQTAPVINHKDGNKLNNRLDNLEWCTISYNNSHAYKNGLRSQNGELNHRHKLKESDIIEIRRRKAIGETCISIAKDYGVRDSAISRICTRKRWAHV